MTDATPTASRVLVLEPGRAEQHYWRDIWAYRQLFAIMAWRDLAVRYKQTVIGIAWALIRPLATMIVFTIVFGKIAALPSEGAAPYAVMVFAGLLPWTFFATALTEAAGSLIGNSNLISKVYFPRLIVPIAAVMVALLADRQLDAAVRTGQSLAARGSKSRYCVSQAQMTVGARSNGPGSFRHSRQVFTGYLVSGTQLVVVRSYLKPGALLRLSLVVFMTRSILLLLGVAWI
jgi:hypothetical protein